MNNQSEYAPIDPIKTGAAGQCPRCGHGQLFQGFLTVRSQCASCQLDFSFADSGDGPAVFVMTAVGFILVGLALWMEVNYSPPFWLHLVLWFPLAIGLSLFLLRVMKGIAICLQYKNDAKPGEIDRG